MRTFSEAGRVLGALEERVMRSLWDAGRPLLVREVRQLLGDGDEPAHTTVMTTLDRLFKKGLLSREREGTAFVYQPAMTEDEFRTRVVEEAVSGLIAESAGSVLAAFVDVAARIDEGNLKRLERLIADRRRKGSK